MYKYSQQNKYKCCGLCLHVYTGTAEYSIQKIDENAIQLLRIGLLIGAGPKPSFGLGFIKMIDSSQKILNAEIELNVLWEKNRNNKNAKLNWQFTTESAFS